MFIVNCKHLVWYPAKMYKKLHLYIPLIKAESICSSIKISSKICLVNIHLTTFPFGIIYLQFFPVKYMQHLIFSSWIRIFDIIPNYWPLIYFLWTNTTEHIIKILYKILFIKIPQGTAGRGKLYRVPWPPLSSSQIVLQSWGALWELKSIELPHGGLWVKTN